MKMHDAMRWLMRTVLLAVLAAAGVARAGTYTWDADGAGPVSGGTGLWDTASALWSNTSTTAWSTWPNTTPNTDLALFSGTPGGIVTIAAGQTINVNAIKIGSTATVNYRFAGGDANSVLAFSGNDAKVFVGVNSMTLANGNAPTFSNLTINTGSGVTFQTSAGNFVLAPDAIFTGTGLVTIGITNVGGWFGSTTYLRSTNNAGFAGGFAVNSLSALCTETLLSALASNSLGTGTASVSGLSRLLYGWGAQTPVGGILAGIVATNGGVVDLTGSYGNSLERFTIAPGGVLRGGTGDLARISRVTAFSSSPTKPEAILAAGVVIAITNKTSSPLLQNLPSDASLYFGLGNDFDASSFSIDIGAGTPWKGLANDTQVSSASPKSRRLSAGTVTVHPGTGCSEIAFFTQGRGGTKATSEQFWTGASGAGYQYNLLVVGNNTALPAFTLASGSSLPARVMGGSGLVLDGANFAPAAISKYVITESGMLMSCRTNALNGRDVVNEGGVLALNPGYIGSPSNVTDTAGTFTVGRHSRVYVTRKTAGTLETLIVSNIVRSGRAVLEICNATSGQLGGDERFKVLDTTSIVRGKIVDPFILGTKTATWDQSASSERYDFLVANSTYGLVSNPAYDTAWGNGNVVTGVTSVAGSVTADSLWVGASITGAGATINLGVLPEGSQATRAGIIGAYSSYGNTVSPVVNAGTSELVVFCNNLNGFLTLNNAVVAAGLTKDGLLPLNLAGTSNNIAGPVTVWAGPLVVTGGNGPGTNASVYIGTLGTFTVNVSQSILGLAGVGANSIAANKTNIVLGTLSPGDATNSLTVTSTGTLSVWTNATAAFSLDYATTPTGTPRLVMPGNLLLIKNGAVLKLNALANMPSGRFDRTFTLVRYGSRSGSFAAKVQAPDGVIATVAYDDVNGLLTIEVQNRAMGTALLFR